MTCVLELRQRYTKRMSFDLSPIYFNVINKNY